MDKKELQEMMAKSATAALDSYKTEVAEKDAKAVAEANLKAIEVGKTQAEKTAEALETKIKADGDNYSKAISEMSEELKSAKDEMAAMQASKMQFSEVGSGTPTDDELNQAFITSKILGKSVDKLDLGKKLIEKSTRWNDTDWETTWNSNIFQGIQNRVVVEPLFETIAMNARVMNFPFNPDTGVDATWVDITNADKLNDGDKVGTAFKDDSAGVTRAHGLTEKTLTAFKLATREYIGYEEDEDSIIPIAGIVRDAIIRRMARTSDASLIGATIAAPFTSLSSANAAGGHSGNTVTTGSATDLVVASEIHTMRANMGQWGMNPSDLVCILSQAAYYNLVSSVVTNETVTTVDKYGDKATMLTGELGKLWGISLIVSDAMPATATGVVQAIMINPSNYLLGTHRGLTLEMATDVVAQQRAMVATRRFGFIAKEAGAAGKASTAAVKFG
jgi:HK97 family phage major capsid protein